MAIKTNTDNKSKHTQNSSKHGLLYVNNNTIVLDLPFILTLNKELKIGMPYMLLEGNHTMAIRLLDVSDVDGVVYLSVQELQTLKTYTVSWNLNYEGDYWLWSLADHKTLYELSN